MRIPPRQFDDARRQIFLQWRFAGVIAQSTLEQRFAGKIQINRRVSGIEECMDAHIGRACIDRRPRANLFAELVAHGVLDSQGNKIKTLERAAVGIDLDLDRHRHVKPRWPGLQECRIVNVLLLFIRKVRDPPKYAARYP